MPDDFEWKRFEQELTAELLRALGRLGREHGAEEFYVVALHGVHRVLDGLLCLPLLGAATTTGAATDEDGFWGARWNPADWAFCEIPIREDVALRLEGALTSEATRGTPAHWRRVEGRYFRVLVRVARRLRDEAPSLLRVTDEFVAFWHDNEGGPKLAARTISKRRFAKLFPEQLALEAAERDLASQPEHERAALLISRLGQYEGITSEMAQGELLALGVAALPALVGALSGKHGWVAAKVVGQIGVADTESVAALREEASTSFWHAMALGMLGDFDWLSQQDEGVAVPGLCARLKAITSGGRVHPLDYGRLEALLDSRDEQVLRRVEKELKPGSSYVKMATSDVAEARRGMRSQHAVVRWHAASLAGDRGLGKRAGTVLLPGLAERLTDPHHLVRRLALLALSYWKTAAAPYHDAMHALRDDPDETVRNTVAHVFR